MLKKSLILLISSGKQTFLSLPISCNALKRLPTPIVSDANGFILNFNELFQPLGAVLVKWLLIPPGRDDVGRWKGATVLLADCERWRKKALDCVK